MNFEQQQLAALATRSAFELMRMMSTHANAQPECASMMENARALVLAGARFEVAFAFGAETEIVLGVIDDYGTRTKIASIPILLPNPPLPH